MELQYSPAPHFDLEEEYVLQTKLLACIRQGLVESAHDVTEGGLLSWRLPNAVSIRSWVSRFPARINPSAGCLLVWRITKQGSGFC
ncbi:MAG: hypothetical protein WDM78_16890 [Puia sp.]